MRHPFLLPDIGEGLTEAVVRKWHVTRGQTVKEDDLLCEIETDKAVVEITSPCDGEIKVLNGAEGDTLNVGTLLIEFETAGSEAVPGQDATPPATAPEAAAATPAPVEAAPPVTVNHDVRATPSTRKFAREHGIDLTGVAGSGPGGRILRDDLSGVTGAGMTGAGVTGAGVTALGVQASAVPDTGPVAVTVPRNAVPPAPGQQRIPIRGLRKAIAETMVRSVTVVPHATSFFRCSGERFLDLRKTLQDRLGVRVSFTAMVVKALVPALQRYPYFNASVDDVRNEIVLPGAINVGFAAHTEDGLLVPVIKGADRKSLAEISAEIDRLAGLARDRKIAPEDLRGGTITLSNVGSHGSADVTGGRPIINHPQSAVIVMSRIRPQPVVRNGQVVAHPCMDIGSSYDHRIIDGVYANQFLETLINVIEEPGLLIGM